MFECVNVDKPYWKTGGFQEQSPFQLLPSLFLGITISLCAMMNAHAGNQAYERMSASVKSSLHAEMTDNTFGRDLLTSMPLYQQWVNTISKKVEPYIPERNARIYFLETIYYESSRAGLDPELVLGIIQLESGFRKYAISSSGARGYMQVMPFWVNLIGQKDDNLFSPKTNLRYGCTILRHYLDIEKGNLFRALGRYNGSLGQSIYPLKVLNLWQKYQQNKLI